MKSFFSALVLLLGATSVQAAGINYLTQSRSVSVDTIDCPGYGGSIAADDFGEFSAAVSEPDFFFQVPEAGCEDRVRAEQASALGADAVTADLLARSGSGYLDGGGPAISAFEVTFSLDTATWLQINGQRVTETALGPYIVASTNDALLETIGGSVIALDWGDPLNEEVLNGGKQTWTLDALVHLQPGDYRLTLTSLSHVDGIQIEYGAYRENTLQFAMTTAVPIPAAVWLFGSALLGLSSASWLRRKQA